jgi:hypothetical protein
MVKLREVLLWWGYRWIVVIEYFWRGGNPPLAGRNSPLVER